MSNQFSYEAEPFQGFTEFDESESLDEFDEFEEPEFGDFELFESDFEFEPEEEGVGRRVPRAAGARSPARAARPGRGAGARGPGRRAPSSVQRPGMRQARARRGPAGMRPGMRRPGGLRRPGGMRRRPGMRPPGPRPPGAEPGGIKPQYGTTEPGGAPPPTETPRPRPRWPYPYPLRPFRRYVFAEPPEVIGGGCPTVGRFGNWLRSGGQVTVLLDEDETPIEGGPDVTASASATTTSGPTAAGGPEAGPEAAAGPEATGATQDASSQPPSSGEPAGTEGELSGLRFDYEVDSEGRPITRRGRWSRRGRNIVVHLDDQEGEIGEVPLLKKGIAAAGAKAAAQAKKIIAKKAGMSPEKVCWIQNVLNTTQGESLVVDGIFGPKTRAAVIRFQTKNGLQVDGVVGPQTETALIQVALNQIARASLLPVNGVKDSKTRQEIINFQSSNNLVTDGIVGPKTRAAMVTSLGGRCVFKTPTGPRPKPGPFVQTPSPCNRDELIRLVNRCVEDSKRCLINAHQDLGIALLACRGDPVCNAAEMGKYLLALKRCRDALLLCDQDARTATKCP